MAKVINGYFQSDLHYPLHIEYIKENELCSDGSKTYEIIESNYYSLVYACRCYDPYKKTCATAKFITKRCFLNGLKLLCYLISISMHIHDRFDSAAIIWQQFDFKKSISFVKLL